MLQADTLQDFFDLFERALNHASRLEVLERLRPIFTMFLEVFDLPSSSEGASLEVRWSVQYSLSRVLMPYISPVS